MRNLVSLLCLRDGIRTVNQLASAVNIPPTMAFDILAETIDKIPDEVVNRLCKLFKVTPKKLLCVEIVRDPFEPHHKPKDEDNVSS